MVKKLPDNFVPTDDLFGNTSDLTESLCYFYLSKNGLGFQFQVPQLLENPNKLLLYFYCFLVLFIFPSRALATSSPPFGSPGVIGNRAENFSEEKTNNSSEAYSLPTITSKANIIESSQQDENYKIIVATGLSLEYQDEQVYQSSQVETNFLDLASEISQNGLALDATRLSQLRKYTQMSKNLFTNNCRNLFKVYAPAIDPVRYIFPPIDLEIPSNSSGLCRTDENDQVIEMVSTKTLEGFFRGDFVKAQSIRSQIATIQKTERFLNSLEDGVSLTVLQNSLTEISTLLKNLEIKANMARHLIRKPTTNVSVRNIQIYTPPIPIFKANVAAQINFASQDAFLGLGKAFFYPFYSTRLWEMKFGGVLGFDFSCGYNFSNMKYSGLRAKSFVGLGVQL